ncbi:MAG: hypothetical protein AAF388_03560, partial [Bacteroidota bacterium]
RYRCGHHDEPLDGRESADVSAGVRVLLPGQSAIASRALIDIALDEIFVNDLREFLTINDLVAQVKARSPHMDLYRMSSSSGKRIRLQQFQTILIEPEKEMGNIIDFSPDKIQDRRKHGFEMAKKAFSQYDGSLKGHLFSNRSV